MGKVGTEATLLNILGEVQKLTQRSDLATYQGIVATLRSGGIVPNGTEFTVPHAVYGNIDFVVRRRNEDKLLLDENAPTLTIQPKYLLSVNGGTSAATFQYDRPEAFASVEGEIPTGTVCKFTTITYSSWAAGTYHFTATSAIPAGAKLCISGNQNTALTSLKVNAYASAKATSPLSSFDISSGEGDATVDLGAWGTDANHPQRVSYGSNNEAESNIFQWLNGIGLMSDLFVPKTKYDMMDTSFVSKQGFLGGFPEEFRACLGLAKIHNIANDVYESDDSSIAKSTEYTHSGYFWLPSRKEIYGSNENAREDSETQFTYYREIATANHDKLMYAKGATNAATYWLRTPSAGYASFVRICYAGDDGALGNSSALRSYGVAPLAILA